jgi:hypothetical protein
MAFIDAPPVKWAVACGKMKNICAPAIEQSSPGDPVFLPDV